MCTFIHHRATLKTATKDIVCYKAIRTKIIVDNNVLKSGDKCIATIKGIQYSGCLIKEKILSNYYFYFCSDNKNLKGSVCLSNPNFAYSWLLDSHVSSIQSLDGKEALQQIYVSYYQDFPVKIGETYTSELLPEKGPVARVIHKGLHSYRDRKKTQMIFAGQSKLICQCVIPKGAQYYIGGDTRDDRDIYVSNIIKYVALIE